MANIVAIGRCIAAVKKCISWVASNVKTFFIVLTASATLTGVTLVNFSDSICQLRDYLPEFFSCTKTCDGKAKAIHGVFYFSDRDTGKFPHSNIRIIGKTPTCDYDVKEIIRIEQGRYSYSVLTDGCSVGEEVQYFLNGEKILINGSLATRNVCQTAADINLSGL